MSYLKPDYNYKPSSLFSDKKDAQKLEISETNYKNKKDLIKSLHDFVDTIDHEELLQFYNNTVIAVKTNINVLDSVSFLKKFNDAYVASVKKTFPDLSSEKLLELEEMLNSLEKYVAELLKSTNVENKFLIPLSLGILHGLLNYENY